MLDFIFLATIAKALCYKLLSITGCYHSVKDNKSESKSQLYSSMTVPRSCCYHSVKDNKSESKSQRCYRRSERGIGCYHSVKDNKSESKSQQHYVKWQHTNTAMDKVVI